MTFLENEFPEFGWVEDSTAGVFRGTYKGKTYEVPFETTMDTTKLQGIRGRIQQFKTNA